MKKVLAEVIDQPTTGELQTRISVLEARIEKLDPSPKIETLEPYLVGSNVYSISDLEGRYPLAVVGYDRGTGRILVLVSPDDAGPRSLPLESVRPLEQCPRAQPTPSQKYEHIADQKLRAELEFREAARFAATTRPASSSPPIRAQERYGPTREWGSGEWK
jgi:hypothetical protein